MKPWLALLALAASVPLAGQARDTTARYARITYLTGVTAYLNAGRDDGLRDSTRLEVFRGSKRVGTIRVAYLAAHQAACDIIDTTSALTVGDSVRFIPALLPRTAVATREPWSPNRTRSRTLTGAAGLEYFSVTGGGVRLSQPGLDLRVFGGPAGSSLSVAVDLRERRTTTAAAGVPTAVAGESRFYQAAVRWRTPGSSLQVGLGRQFVDGLPAAGLIDGLQVGSYGPAWTVGAFVGTLPGLSDLQISGDIRTLGAYLRRQGRPAAGGFWSLTAGASGSYQGQAFRTNREFFFLEAKYFGPRVSGFLSQEVDYYRPWKRLPGEGPFSPTATFGQARFQATGIWSLQGGVDERRNVRLFEDAVSPESTFDAAFRRGAWVGTTLQPNHHVLVDLDARASDGGTIGRTDSYTGAVAVERLGTLGAGFRARATRYLSPGRAGWLGAASVGIAPADRWRVGLNAGQRREDVAILIGPQITRWVGGDFDVSVARSWFATVSFTRQRGAQQDADQLFALLSYHF
jgi:hypothetical protein